MSRISKSHYKIQRKGAKAQRRKGNTLCVSASLRLCVILFVFWLGPISADPWGKDADLVHKPPTCIPQTYSSLPEKMIRFHQEVISPADGPRSHFIPSSSQYTLDAMRKYGFFQGFLKGCDRLQRENKEEWVYRKILNDAGVEMKWDPIR